MSVTDTAHIAIYGPNPNAASAACNSALTSQTIPETAPIHTI